MSTFNNSIKYFYLLSGAIQNCLKFSLIHMKIFHWRIKFSAILQILTQCFPCETWSQKLRLSIRLAASINCIFPGFTREPDIGDFLSYRIMGKKVFAFPVFSLQLSKLQDLWPVNSVINWPENILRVKLTGNYTSLCHGLLPPVRSGSFCTTFLHLFPRKAVRQCNR